MCALDPLLLIPRIEYVEDIYEFVTSQTTDYCLVILDMTNFHIVNDIYGYNTGDMVIRNFMHYVRKSLPSGSISLRFRHGDEFLFFIPGNVPTAETAFMSFRDRCESTSVLSIDKGVEIFVSFRFAAMQFEGPGERVETMLARAEKALREVKGQGSPRL
jgi:diguanylate cyclase (GGDEF)-like protein